MPPLIRIPKGTQKLDNKFKKYYIVLERGEFRLSIDEILYPCQETVHLNIYLTEIEGIKYWFEFFM